MGVKSEIKKTVRVKEPVANATQGFLVRKKYLDSDEWNYFQEEMDCGFLWVPASALKLGGSTVAIFATQEMAERMVKHIEEYHNWRKSQGQTSGFDVSVEEVNLESAAATK